MLQNNDDELDVTGLLLSPMHTKTVISLEIGAVSDAIFAQLLEGQNVKRGISRFIAHAHFTASYTYRGTKSPPLGPAPGIKPPTMPPPPPDLG